MLHQTRMGSPLLRRLALWPAMAATLGLLAALAFPQPASAQSGTERLLQIQREREQEERGGGAEQSAEQGAQSGTERLLQMQREREQAESGGSGEQAAQGQQATVTVEASGRGSWRDDDPARSREEALEAALRNAVEEVSGVLISSESRMRNFDLVKDEVLSRTEGYVKDYEVLQEGRDGPFYAVSLRAEISRRSFIDDVDASLARLYERVGKPRVLLVVEEGEVASRGLDLVEKEVRRLLLRENFTFIDAQAVQGGGLLESAEKGRGGERSGLLDAARTTKAELLMVGRGQITKASEVSRFYSVEASVGLDVLRTDTGQVMASDVATGEALHIDRATAEGEALQKAAAAITPRIMEQVTFQWIRERNEGGRVELIVRNATYNDVLSLRRILSNEVGGVQQVTQRSFNQGEALLELNTIEPPDRLAEALLTTPMEFPLQVESVTRGGLIVAVQRPQAAGDGQAEQAAASGGAGGDEQSQQATRAASQQ